MQTGTRFPLRNADMVSSQASDKGPRKSNGGRRSSVNNGRRSDAEQEPSRELFFDNQTTKLDAKVCGTLARNAALDR